MHGVWALARRIGRWRHSVIYQAGSMVLIAVAFLWAGLLTLGFALIYWQHLPAGFHVSTEIPASATRGFDTALYVSLASLTTLGSSDVVPLSDGLRYAGVLEAFFGVAVITAWITWVLSIYPVIAEWRTFTRIAIHTRETYPPPERAVTETPQDAMASLLRSLTEHALRVQSDLEQTRVSYYFQNRTAEISLAAQLPFVLALARAAEHAHAAPAVRHHGMLLRRAVESLLRAIAQQFLDVDEHASPEEVLDALAKDHLLAEAERIR
jgi:hypothetical protein